MFLPALADANPFEKPYNIAFQNFLPKALVRYQD